LEEKQTVSLKEHNLTNNLFREIIGRGIRLKKDISEAREYHKKLPQMTNQELSKEMQKYLNEKRKHKKIGGN
jgi:hypothetical protein